ncbi:HlyD family type I secretion periplasmic adaptor subunit, partial [Aeromonas jandaei]|uniref:HlyD family type I secretion periplasmic adaptor subunit n=1 Tax=Aeromonas jandaei TaxID=650 RepID=UPI002AA0C825
LSLFRLRVAQHNASRHEYDFLPAYLEVVERPPSPLAITSALVITLSLLTALAWSVFGKLDIHASAMGQVIVSSRTKVIQSVIPGEVVGINVSEGQSVKKGDVLIRLNPVSAKAELARIVSQLEFVQLELIRYETLINSGALSEDIFPTEISANLRSASMAALHSDMKEINAQMDSFAAELKVNHASNVTVQKELADLQRLAKNVKTRLNARRKLEQSKAIAPMEVLEVEKELLELERNQQQLLSRLAVLSAEREKLTEQRNTYMAGKHREYQNKRNDLSGRLAELNQELVKANEASRVQVLRSPVDGTIQQLQINTLGGVVQSGDKLMVIVPDNAQLEIEAMLLNTDAGFVYPGQAVEVKVDAFTYTKYGTISGVVSHVSKDAIKDEKLGLVFPVRINLSTNKIQVEERLVRLQPGMSVVAEIKTGRRRVIEYVLSPLQEYQSEALRER